ncbi:MAG: spherulation-specific family 4 protein [Betaproteobacteria bacterium]|nr:spherulation-specific family 4 protein [Betaproteobacteria bacterium]
MGTSLRVVAPRCARLLVGLVAGLAAYHAQALELLVPAYFRSDWTPNYWANLTASAPSASIWAVFNPGNGPGGSADATYQSAIGSFNSAGGHTVGYVFTSYGSRNIADVKQDVDRYLSYYGPTNLSGFFVDEMAYDNNSAHFAYYNEIYGYIKTQSSGYRVFGNPGQNTLVNYASYADTLVTFDSNTGYPGFTPDAWNAGYSADHFAHLAYGVADSATMTSYIDLAVARNAGFVYFTDDPGSPVPTENNPWDTLPSYWNAEVAYVAAVPEPHEYALMLAGIPLAAWAARRRRRHAVPAPCAAA